MFCVSFDIKVDMKFSFSNQQFSLTCVTHVTVTHVTFVLQFGCDLQSRLKMYFMRFIS